ncbi:MAG: hypothetical protein LBV77_05105 [Candidatus Adiutrix intracellularis]|jgi:hypothetical protein|nr:hypothetical protein [Candidatus Adiutrix intracellularis]
MVIKILTSAWPQIWETLNQGGSTWLFVVKLTLPALLVARFLLFFNWVPTVASFFEPVMTLVGLPPETALIWVAGMIANHYVAISIYFSFLPIMEPLSLAQMTVLGGMGLMAHSLLLEGQICRGAGLSFWRVTLFRMLAAFLWGLVINQIARLTGWGEEPAQRLSFLNFSSDPVPPWDLWIWLTLKQLLVILVIIESLLLFIKLSNHLGLTRLLIKILGLPLRLVGINESVLMLTLIGGVLGLTYGGGLIVAESRSGHIPPQDIYNAMMLLCIFHSLIEDSFLMWSIGGSLIFFLFVRLVLALVLSAAITRLADRVFWRPLLVGRKKDPAE